MNKIHREVDMEFTVTVTYKVVLCGASISDCHAMTEDMTLDDIHKEGVMQDVEFSDGVQI